MKAVVKYGYGPFETELRDIEEPTPKGNDILLKVVSAGVCGTDLNLDAGKEQWMLHPPVVLGHEFSGTVAWAGENSRFKVGDRVVSDNTGYVCGECSACAHADYLACVKRLGLGYGMNGGFTSCVLIPGEILQRHVGSLFLIPEKMTFDEAAIMDPCANSYRIILQDAKIRPGENVVIYGLGALGLFCVQFARIAGADRIVCVGLERDRHRFEIAKRFGATDCLVSGKNGISTFAREIREGVQVVVDCAGSNAILEDVFNYIEPRGRFVKVGWDESPLNFSIDKIIQIPVSVIGHIAYDFECWDASLKLYSKGLLDFKSIITHRFPLSNFREAFDTVRNGQAIKAILYPSEQ
jgi:threonine dehydrogenase-like Zn-dependent dehydrogenase